MFTLQALREEWHRQIFVEKKIREAGKGRGGGWGEVWFSSLTPRAGGRSGEAAPTALRPRGPGAVPGKGAAPLNFGPEAFGR